MLINMFSNYAIKSLNLLRTELFDIFCSHSEKETALLAILDRMADVLSSRIINLQNDDWKKTSKMMIEKGGTDRKRKRMIWVLVSWLLA